MRRMLSFRFMREHRWTAKHLSEYIDRELSRPERERVEEHVELCPKCNRLLAALHRTVAGLATLRRGATADPALTAGVIERLEAEG